MMKRLQHIGTYRNFLAGHAPGKELRHPLVEPGHPGRTVIQSTLTEGSLDQITPGQIVHILVTHQLLERQTAFAFLALEGIERRILFDIHAAVVRRKIMQGQLVMAIIGRRTKHYGGQGIVAIAIHGLAVAGHRHKRRVDLLDRMI